MDTKDISVNNISEPCCPKCGSKNLEDTSGTEVAKTVGKFAGRIAIELLDVPLQGILKQAAGKAGCFVGEEVGKMIYHRLTCQKCGYTGWRSEFENAIDKINGIIAKVLAIDEYSITENSTFAELGADSLDMIELVMEFEKEYNISISDEVAMKVETVGDVYYLVSSLK